MPGPEAMECVPHTDVRSTASQRPGDITLITGCMFSGKTTTLLDSLANRPAGTAVAVRHSIDDRYRTDAIVSHDGRVFPARTINCANDLLPWNAAACVRMLVVDEVHFLDESLIDAVEALSRDGLNVMMAGLDLDSWGRPFPMIARLGHAATHTLRRFGVCARCGGVADHTQRLTPIAGGRMVGGPESYEPRCGRCWTPPPASAPGARQTIDQPIASITRWSAAASST